MINGAEKELLIEIMANIDDLKAVLTECQKIKLDRPLNRINRNYTNLLEGIPEKEV